MTAGGVQSLAIGRTDSKATHNLWCYQLPVSTYNCEQWYSYNPNNGNLHLCYTIAGNNNCGVAAFNHEARA